MLLLKLQNVPKKTFSCQKYIGWLVFTSKGQKYSTKVQQELRTINILENLFLMFILSKAHRPTFWPTIITKQSSNIRPHRKTEKHGYWSMLTISVWHLQSFCLSPKKSPQIYMQIRLHNINFHYQISRCIPLDNFQITKLNISSYCVASYISNMTNILKRKEHSTSICSLENMYIRPFSMKLLLESCNYSTRLYM